MHIEITAHNVRTLAQRLQKSLGTDPEDAIKRSKAYEALAALCGQPNWDTLSALLQQSSEAPSMQAPKDPQRAVAVALQDPVAVYAFGKSTDEWADAPAWVGFTVDDAFIQRLLALRDHVGQGSPVLSAMPKPQDEEVHLISSAANTLITWHDPEPDAPLNIWGEELQVDRSSFWFHARPKHADWAVEMRRIYVEELLSALRERGKERVGDRCHWLGGDTLLVASDAEVGELVQGLFEAGEITRTQAQRFWGEE